MPWKNSVDLAQRRPRSGAWMLPAILLSALGLTSVVQAADAPREPARLRAQSRELTNTLVALAQGYVAADESARSGMLPGLIEAARQRRSLLHSMLENDPGNVFGLAFPATLRARLPAEARALIEQHRHIDGTLTVLYEDREFDGRLVHALQASGRRIPLRFTGDAPALRSGMRVRVAGLDFNGQIAVEPGDAGVLLLAADGDPPGGTAAAVSATTLPNTLGEQRTLVLLANFQDDPSQPLSVAGARDLVFGQVDPFLRENSQGQAWLSGEVHGWFTLPLSRSVCNLPAAGDAADQAARQAGINISAYSRIIYLFTDTACSVSGMGEVGVMPSRAYIDGVAADLSITSKTIAHELGHNFGLNHSHALDCGDVAAGTGCQTIEYGDTYDTMGNPDFGHFNAFQKERLGWLTAGGSALVTQVGGDGAYAISAYEAPGTAPKVLKVPRGVDAVTGRARWFYIEYRQARGYDSFLNERSGVMLRGDVTHGVVVHLAEDGNGNSSQLLHMSLDSQARQIYGFTDWFDPALDIGSTYWDDLSGIGITAESADGSTAVVRVSVGTATCLRAAPSAVVSPVQATGLAGGQVSYTVTVRNQDSAGCPASTFELASTTPAGWSSQFAAAYLNLQPGASQATTLLVTAASTSPGGLFEIVATARSAAQSTLAGSAIATYLVETPLADSPPVAVDDAATTTINTPVTIAVLANDRDPEGQPLRVTAVTNGGKGGVTINADGTVTYRPNAKASGQDAFAYTISDGRALDSGTVSVQIGRRRK